MDVALHLARNRILADLPDPWLLRLAPHLEPVDLPAGMVLEAPGEPVGHVYFPASGVISTVAVDLDGRRMEAAIVGREGMSGLPVVLGGDRSPHETLVQIDGTGHRIPAATLREALRAEPGLHGRFLLYAQAVLTQVAQTALANGRHTIEERLARWLLMCHDRTEGDLLELTHEFLSLMLGVRRAGVTVAMHVLEGRGLVKANRGRIRILDREGLKAATRGLYGVCEAEHARLMGGGGPAMGPSEGLGEGAARR